MPTDDHAQGASFDVTLQPPPGGPRLVAASGHVIVDVDLADLPVLPLGLGSTFGLLALHANATNLLVLGNRHVDGCLGHGSRRRTLDSTEVSCPVGLPGASADAG
jgi:hypothetical protein